MNNIYMYSDHIDRRSKIIVLIIKTFHNSPVFLLSLEQQRKRYLGTTK